MQQGPFGAGKTVRATLAQLSALLNSLLSANAPLSLVTGTLSLALGPGLGINGSNQLYIPNNAITNAMMALSGGNTLRGNPTGSSAVPSDIAVPSCPPGTGNHLNWTSGVGFTCDNSVNAGIATVSKTANYTVLAADNGVVFDNNGAAGEVDFTLPTEADGLGFCFAQVVGQVVKIIAPTGVTLTVGNATGVTGGNLTGLTTTNSGIGNFVCFYAPKGFTTAWLGSNVGGNWNLH